MLESYDSTIALRSNENQALRRLAKHEIITMSHYSQHHFIIQYISLRGTAVNEFYRIIRMGVAGHVRGNRTETNE